MVDAILQQNQAISEKPIYKKFDFKETNYLNCRLGANEQQKILKIRLLPFSETEPSPFHLIHMHPMRVDKSIAPSGYKSYVCLRTTPEVQGAMGDKCPICELHDEVNNLLRSGNVDPSKIEVYKQLKKQTNVHDVWVVRVIDREHEDEGPKFWKFNSNLKHDGIYDKLFNLFSQRYYENGDDLKYNIFDLYNGKDLYVTITKDSNGKPTYQIMDAGQPSPLSRDKDQLEAWVKDEKKWTDVYVAKPYDYLKIISAGGVPFYDKNAGRWVNSKDYNNQQAQPQYGQMPMNGNNGQYGGYQQPMYETTDFPPEIQLNDIDMQF